MIIFLILLVLTLIAIAIFAAQNNQTENMTFVIYSFKGVPEWLPPVVAGGVIAILMILYILYAGTRHGFARRGLRRHIGERDRSIASLQDENQRLKEELAAYQGRAAERGAPTDR